MFQKVYVTLRNKLGKISTSTWEVYQEIKNLLQKRHYVILPVTTKKKKLPRLLL